MASTVILIDSLKSYTNKLFEKFLSFFLLKIYYGNNNRYYELGKKLSFILSIAETKNQHTNLNIKRNVKIFRLEDFNIF